jgi:NitT/TauT family transport system substrate-binding protein
VQLKRQLLNLVIACWLALAACSPSTIALKAPVPFKIAIGPFTSYAPLFIAQEEGYFEDEGLSVEFVTLPSSKDMIPSLAQGTIDAAGVTLTSSVLNLMAEGADVRFVADRGFADPNGCTYSAVLASVAMANKQPAEFSGANVATDQASYQEFLMDAALGRGSLSTANVSVQNTVISAVPELMSSGQIDLATAVEPWVTRIASNGQGVIWAPAQKLLPDFEFLAYIFGPSVLDGNRDAGVRFMRAYLRAKAQYELGKTDRNVEIVAKYTNLDPELVRQSCWVPLQNDLRVDADSINQFQAWSVSRGYSTRILDESEFSDTSFVSQVSGP